MQRIRKTIVFTKPDGKVVSIEKVEGAYVKNDYLHVPSDIHSRFKAYFAYWRGIYYTTRAITE